MDINQMSAEKVAAGSGISSDFKPPTQAQSELQKRGSEINTLYHQANDLRIRVRQIADSVYGDEEIEEEATATGINSMSGSMNCLGSEIEQLEQALAELRGQVSRLENL